MSRSELRREVLAPIIEHVLSADRTNRPDHCPRCRGVRGIGHELCYHCTWRTTEVEDAQLFFAASVEKESPFYSSFKGYKSVTGVAAGDHLRRMAATLSGGFDQHADNITSVLGGPPTIVSAVPSTRGKSWDQHPIAAVIKMVGALSDRAQACLRHTNVMRVPRVVQHGLFEPVTETEGARVLLVEDMWVTGSTAETAAMSLMNAGAKVAILTIGRELNPKWETTSQLIESLGPPAWLHL
jgi:hypothetical protein